MKGNSFLIIIFSSGTDPLTVLMGFADGSIRVTNINVEDISYLSDYIEYSIHDNRLGRVKKLCFSQDNRMMYTYGNDGNIFSFMFQCNNSDIEKNSVPVSKFPMSPKFMVGKRRKKILIVIRIKTIYYY